VIRTTYNDLRYLHVQVGELSEWIDDPSWYARYVLHLSQRFNMIQPHLPSGVREYCDIGGGLCGIGILINDYFGGNVSVNVVDGDGPPTVVHHALPFNNAEQTLAYLHNNNVHKAAVWQPRRLPHQQFDLITSFRAWCFHFDPGAYIDFVVAQLSPHGKLIVDVRTDKPDYLTSLRQAFRKGSAIGISGKGTLWQFQL
jgi:hypothetical protein